MKTILVATDFSEASLSALSYARSLASAFNARFILFHAYTPVSTPAETLATVQPADVRDDVMQHLNDELRSLNHGELPYCYAECEEGDVVDSILSKVREKKVDLVVAGMKMEHKGFRKVFGSTVTSLCTKSPVPVLVVPESSNYRDIKVMAVAFESDVPENSSPYLLDSVREFSERFAAAVYLVKVFDDSLVNGMMFQQRPYRMIKMLRTTDPVFESLDGNNIVEELLQYIENRDVDVLAILSHNLPWIQKAFHQSVTKQLIFSSHIPLLVIPTPA